MNQGQEESCFFVRPFRSGCREQRVTGSLGCTVSILFASRAAASPDGLNTSAVSLGSCGPPTIKTKPSARAAGVIGGLPNLPPVGRAGRVIPLRRPWS